MLLLISGVIGSSIFLTAKDIAGPLPHPVLFLLVWVLGALISLCACFAFAELGSMFPDSGGQYIYLREAYGDLIAFLYGWMLFSVANGGSIAALSVASAAYFGEIFPGVSRHHVVMAFAGIVITRAHLLGLLLIAVLTLVNVLGLRWGALLQNVSSGTKFTAMAVFVILGFAIGKGHWSNFHSHGVGLTMGLGPAQLISALGVGMIAVFWAYDGWVYITWVAGEVKEPRRNVPLAMVLGVIAVAVIYIAMNLTYIYALPLKEIAARETIAHAAAAALFSTERRGVAVADDRDLLFQRGGDLHAFGRARLSRHGAGWRFFQAHGCDPSQVANAGVQPDWTRHLGWGPHSQRALRPALYLCYLRHGAVLHANGNRHVSVALEAAGNSASLSLHGISVAARDLRADRLGVDAEHHHHTAHTGVLGHDDRADWRPGIFVLETQQPKGCSSGVKDV